MRTFIHAAVVTGAIVAAFGATPARAQVTETMKFSTTFPFTAGRASFPAGTYTVRPLDPGSSVVEISSRGISRFLDVQPSTLRHMAKGDDEVIFQKNGDGYVLTQLWDGVEQTGWTSAMAITDRHASRHSAKTTREMP